MSEDKPKERLRLGRQKARSTDAINAFEIAEAALEAVEPMFGPPDPAVMLVEEQRRLIRAQTTTERMGFFLRLMTALLGLVFAIGFCLLIVRAVQANDIVVDAFDSPEDLTRRGQTGEVIAKGVRDVVTTIRKDAKDAAGDHAVELTWNRDVAIVVPLTGTSLGDIDKLLRGYFGHETHIGGSVTVAVDGTVSLTIRADSLRSKTFTGPESDMPRLITEASEYIFSQNEPGLFAWYLLQTDRMEDAAAFIPVAYSQHLDARPDLAYSWGVMLATTGHPEEAVQKLRLSLDAAPDNPSGWDMLVGTLFDTEGEEAAYVAGQQMLEAAAREKRPMESANLLLLTRDWTRVLELALEDYQTTAGGTVLGGQESSLADSEGLRHDFATARTYLISAVADEPLTVATGHMIDAYEAIETGDGAAAQAAMSAVDALWRSHDDVAYTFYEGPCYLGLTEGMAGRYPQAEAAFVRGDRYVACAAFRADVLEMQGRLAEADRQYGVAIRLAPSLPFAYQRRAEALLARGDLPRALTRFQDANRRGPRWADPLKGWGDVLAAQGRWAEAAAKYAQAEALAPRWRALHLAHGAALERLGRRDEAQAQRALAQGG